MFVMEDPGGRVEEGPRVTKTSLAPGGKLAKRTDSDRSSMVLLWLTTGEESEQWVVGCGWWVVGGEQWVRLQQRQVKP